MDVGGGDRKLMSDINVTPLVDVVLVLLIIFMVTAPMGHKIYYKKIKKILQNRPILF